MGVVSTSVELQSSTEIRSIIEGHDHGGNVRPSRLTPQLSSGGGCWSYEPGKAVMPPPSAAAPGSAGPICSDARTRAVNSAQTSSNAALDGSIASKILRLPPPCVTYRHPYPCSATFHTSSP